MRTPPSIGITLEWLQRNLPWTLHYSAHFRTNPQTHKDFAHALTHVTKASGQLAALVDEIDHRKLSAFDEQITNPYRKYVADLVICAMRMANTYPGGQFDLMGEVLDRLESKNAIRFDLDRPDTEQLTIAITGPPGSGKTRWAQAIFAMIRNHENLPTPVVVDDDSEVQVP